MKTSLLVKLLLPTFTFHVLIMEKIEKFQLVTNCCRYFDKQNDPHFHNHWRNSYQILHKNCGNYDHHTWGYKCPDCRLWTGKNASCEEWSNIQIFMKNMFMGMYVPRLSHIHVEKTMLSDKTSNTTGPFGSVFHNMLAKGNNKVSVFYANP